MATQPKCDRINSSKPMVFSPLPPCPNFLVALPANVLPKNLHGTFRVSASPGKRPPQGVAKGRGEARNLLSLREAAPSPGQLQCPKRAYFLGTGSPWLPFLSSTTVASQLLLSSISALLAKPLTMFPAPFVLLSKHWCMQVLYLSRVTREESPSALAVPPLPNSHQVALQSGRIVGTPHLKLLLLLFCHRSSPHNIQPAPFSSVRIGENKINFT